MKTLGTHNYFIYILTNKNKTVLYTGITSDLKIRLYQHNHPTQFSDAFTSKYKCYYLVYYELVFDINFAILREKQIKGWSRQKKENLINSFNKEWFFLNDKI